MPDEYQTFLTLSQAIDAVAADFGQYGPQPELFQKIGPLILGNDFKTSTFNGVKQAQVRTNSSQPFKTVDDNLLGFYFIHMLETFEKDAESMAKICALVFQTSARPGMGEEKSGVWIKNHMNEFICKKCGSCCRRLGNECLKEDHQLWERLGRSDILSWVKEEHLDTGETLYRIWVDPKTGKVSDSCPFLAQLPDKKTFSCTIQEVKPLVCQEYPFTKKHAQYTGCKGFEVNAQN